MPAPRPPPDLLPAERDVVAWFAVLGPAAPPPALGAQVLAAAMGEMEGRTSEPRWGAQILAAAALVLLAVGIQAFAGVASRAADTARQERRAEAAIAPAAEVVDDPSVPLFHGLETFGDLSGNLSAEGFLASVGDGR